MKISKKITAFALIIVMLVVPASVSTSAADTESHKNIKISVNGEDKCNVMGLILNYDNNLYISMMGVAYALKDTAKGFDFDVSDGEIHIDTSERREVEPYLWSQEELSETSNLKYARNELTIDGVSRRYYSMTGHVGEGETDVFMNPVTIAMMFDIKITVDETGVSINTESGYDVSAEEMESSGYMQGVNSLYIGDATTGDVYYEFNKDTIVPIASTTKLMTYYLLMDAVSAGSVSLDDNVTLSKNAQLLSEAIDGVIPMTEGAIVPLRELIYGMLLKSSNECALAIAEYVSGSEEAFVGRMNEKAIEAGLTDATFYNCNGLPVYDKQLVPAKMQNRMTSKDMFTLCRGILSDYPQILDITSVKSMELPVLSQSVKNTNAVLYNIDEVKGLKTGTTNKSGACLVTCAELQKDGQNHYLVCVLFGAEGEADRATVSEMAIRYAMKELYVHESTPVVEEEEGIPQNPEDVVKKLIKVMNNRKTK